jgi:hypothetical protein
VRAPTIALSTFVSLVLFNGHVWESDLHRILSALIIKIAKHGHAYDQGTDEYILHVGISFRFVSLLIFKDSAKARSGLRPVADLAA